MKGVRFSRFRDYREYVPNSAVGGPLGNRARTRTRRGITDVRAHVHTRALWALDMAEAHYDKAMSLMNTPNARRPLSDQLLDLMYLKDRGDAFLRAARGSARTMNLPNVQRRANAVNRKAAPLRAR